MDLIPKDHNQNPENYVYKFTGNGPNRKGFKPLNEDGCCVYVGRKEYLWGALHPCYPQVRQHWLNRIQDCIDAGVDGIDIRISNHSSWTNEGEMYGFNEPAVAEFQNRYGINVLTEAFDMDLWKALQGEYWTTFLAQARQLTSDYDLPLQLHISPLRLNYNPWGRYNGIPENFHWDWQNWIGDGLCDAVHLKMWWMDKAFAKEVAAFAKQHNRQVTLDIRLQYRGKMKKPNYDPIPSDASYPQIIERIEHGLDSKNIDAIVLYEGNCFTELDTQRDEIVVMPLMKELLDKFRR
jgi:hypothetical protein